MKYLSLQRRLDIRKSTKKFLKEGEVVPRQSEAKNRREWHKGMITNLIEGNKISYAS